MSPEGNEQNARARDGPSARAIGLEPVNVPGEARVSANEAVLGRRCVLAAAVLWSLSGVVTKRLDLDPLPIALYRSLFAGLALLPFVSRGKRVFRPFMVPLGLIFGAMVGLYIGSIKRTTAANAIFLQYTSLLWLIPASLLFLHERPDRRSLFGVALAMVGLAIIVRFGYDGRPGEGWGILLGVGSGAGYAAVVIILRAQRGLDPIWLSAIGNLGGAIALGAWLAATRGGIPIPSASQTVVLMLFGAIQMAIPYALFARGLRTVGAPEAGLITLIEPVLNPIWVALGTYELPAWPTLVGGAFLLAGMAVRFAPGGRPPVPAGTQETETQPLHASRTTP